MKKIIASISLIILMTGCSSELPLKDLTTSRQWFDQGAERVKQRKTELNQQQKILQQSLTKSNKAKNIIFVVGDGMGVSTLTAARIFIGQQQGFLGEEFALSFEHFPHSALIKTYNVDLQTPDSAGTMSALMTGIKTNEGIISLPDSTVRGDCNPSASLPTFVDLAKAKGKSTACLLYTSPSPRDS